MTPNEIKLQSIENQIGNSDRRQVALFSALLGLNHMRETIEKKALTYLEWKTSNEMPANCDPQTAADIYGSGWARGEGADLLELAKIHASIALLESNPDVQIARATLEPLCAHRAELRAQVAADAAAHAAAHAAACDAERAATTKALAAVENDPSVIAARKALARFEDPEVPLTRGKQSLASAAA
jgi:hypothetical protein